MLRGEVLYNIERYRPYGDCAYATLSQKTPGKFPTNGNTLTLNGDVLTIGTDIFIPSTSDAQMCWFQFLQSVMDFINGDLQSLSQSPNLKPFRSYWAKWGGSNTLWIIASKPGTGPNSWTNSTTDTALTITNFAGGVATSLSPT